MKKILLGTSGLFGAVALFASAASAAQTPTVTIGGVIDFQAGFVSDDLDALQRAQGFRNDSEISIRVDGQADNGLNYGAVIDLEADLSPDADTAGGTGNLATATTGGTNSDSYNAARTYIFVGGEQWVRFELGSNTGAAKTMKLDAGNIARATGGIDGAWHYFSNFPVAAAGPFLTSADNVTGHGSRFGTFKDEVDNNNKITYYSPSFSGFQLGLSYAPDIADRGQTVTRLDTNDAGDIFDGAISYEGNLSGVDLAGAVTGQIGDSEVAGIEDIASWNVGGSAGYNGFTIAASYGDWGDSLFATGANVDQTYFTVGGSYEYGAFGGSVTYYQSEIDFGAAENDFTNLVFGVDYALAPGLTPYAEVSLYDYDTAGTANDNDGTSVILGTQLAF